MLNKKMCVSVRCWLLTFLLLSGLLSLAVLVTPHAARADGGAPNLAYVSGTAHGVSVIDVAQQKITSTLPAGGDPHMVLLSLDARFLYVAQPGLGRVSVLAAKTGETICSADVPGQPSLLAVDNSSNILFAAGNGAKSVGAIDPANCAIKQTLQTDAPVYGLALAAVGSSVSGGNGNQLWVASGQTLTIFDDAKWQKIGSVALPGTPQYISVPPGSTVYTTTREGSVLAVDLTSHNISTLISGGAYGPMDYDANTGEIYVPDQKNSQLVVLAPVNSGFPPPKEPNRTIHLSQPPASVAITSDGQLAFVALQHGDVAMFDLPGRELITMIHVGGTPHFIITGLYPPVVGTTPQQASQWGTLSNVLAYVLLVVLLIVPILLFRRYAQARAQAEHAKQAQQVQGIEQPQDPESRNEQEQEGKLP